MKTNKQVIDVLKTAKGQVDAIIKMVENDRYCVDISNQILAVQALLKKANLNILSHHIKSCVRDAFIEGSGDKKVDEIITVLGTYVK